LSNGGPTSGVLVFFGITGDLSRRYGLPALYNLCKNKLLPEDFEIIGVSRRDVTRESVIEN
jgi:glucose-6-phosphate 1-dehydrogenase